MEIRIIKEPITREELQKIAQERYGNFAKAVVDIEQGIMAVGGDFHAQGEVVLIQQEGSKREHTWGVRLHPDNPPEEFIEFDAMVNVKPSFGNRSRDIENQEIREKVKTVVKKLVAQC